MKKKIFFVNTRFYLLDDFVNIFIKSYNPIEKIKEYLSSWEKDKSIPTDIMSQILNTILFKCNVKALNLSQEVNLPPHIQLPRVKPNKN